MERALQGLKVLDLSMNLPGPYMTWLLASLGAEVLKVENPQGGDFGRSMGASPEAARLSFDSVNRNKKSLALNLKHVAGREIFLRMLDDYDVVVEGFRPGTMNKLGLGWPELSARQPRLIQVSISGYGQSGPYRLRAGHDVNYLALCGVLAMGGSREDELAIAGVQIADVAGGSLMALSGLMAAVVQRQRTGQGQLVDVAMFDGALSMATKLLARVQAGADEPAPRGMTLNGRYPCYNVYRTSDDGFMSLGALEPKFWQGFCQALERPDLEAGQFGGADVIDEVQAIFASRTCEQWEKFFKNHDVCCEPVLSLEEAVQRPLVAARGMLSKDDQGREFLNSPFKLSASPPLPEGPSPRLGQHSREVLLGLGMSPENIEKLVAEGTLGIGP
ncbi:CaiB/BaiF CoA transferase family protein [Desulfoferula mesophila]|uniref:CoA transferase n=1 Tax=Desulfoferula mesophila TaxID=3058419 RepID=A0AAU9EIP8_9BACT|nr:CoA transferase [Desulfoferula mesophilus]